MDDYFSQDTILAEIAWEVCNQVGGIYTVIRSKLPAMIERWEDSYFLIGPYTSNAENEFESMRDLSDPIGQAVLEMREMGLDVHYGRWLVSGRPKVVLLNTDSIKHSLDNIKYFLWENHSLSIGNHDPLLDDVVAFGEMVKIFFKNFRWNIGKKNHLITHFHEWMAASSIAGIRRELPEIKVVFTTHATLLGRYLAMNDSNFYSNLPTYNWEVESKKFNIHSQVQLERAAAHGAHILTTVSEITGRECEHLLGRKIDMTLPNGLNIKRFTAMHESQVLHKKFKEKIHKFVMGHFFPSYSFDLDKTLYFFTSGRFEYQNKGYDLTLESLARLNWKLQQEKTDVTVVMFFVTKKPYYSINPKVLQGRAMMQELQETCDDIKNQVGDRLFYQATLSADHRLPALNDFVDDHLRLRYRRTIQSWKTNDLPMVVTHTLQDPHNDEILSFLRASNLINNSFDRVKVVYHPDFISSINPLFHMDYDDFVRGCHLGVFPSKYEPWGYTPLECIARGIPTITSDLAGFGDYVLKHEEDLLDKGVYVTDRTSKNFDESAIELVDQMMDFIKLDRKDRISQRTNLEMNSFKFDWSHLRSYYDDVYNQLVRKIE